MGTGHSPQRPQVALPVDPTGYRRGCALVPRRHHDLPDAIGPVRLPDGIGIGEVVHGSVQPILDVPLGKSDLAFEIAGFPEQSKVGMGDRVRPDLEPFRVHRPDVVPGHHQIPAILGFRRNLHRLLGGGEDFILGGLLGRCTSPADGKKCLAPFPRVVQGIRPTRDRVRPGCRPGILEHPVKPREPGDAAAFDIAGGDEERGRNPESLEDGGGHIEVVPIAVVEGHGHRVLWQIPSPRNPIHDLGQ